MNLGSLYNGKGNGSVIVWDPFLSFGNVVAGDVVVLTVCLMDGAGDTTGARCQSVRGPTSDG